jgi:hypothetical protein
MSNNNLSVSTNISADNKNIPTWIFTPTKDNFVALPVKKVGMWNQLGINSSLNMKVSFCINIENVSSSYRNIFHVTNNNKVDSRVPSIWININTTELFISSSTLFNPNNFFLSPAIPLNKITNVVLIWKGDTVDVYYDNKIVKSHTSSNPLIPANKNAIVYMCAVWPPYNVIGGFLIKNISFDNNISNSMSKSCISFTKDVPNWIYAPSKDNFVSLSPKMVGKWSDLNIDSSLNMKISFCINIENISKFYRNIFHITNNNQHTSRSPAIWINVNTSELFISCSSTKNLMDFFLSPSLPLNKTTNIVILWKGKLVEVYYDNKMVKSFTFINTLFAANKIANVYVSAPWKFNIIGGFVIKNLNFSNDNSNSISNSCVSSGLPANNTQNNSFWLYSPSKDNLVSLSPNVVGKWSELKIDSSLNMKISFCINIQTIVNRPRNIIHVTNTDQENSRVPGIWINNDTYISVCYSEVNSPASFFLLPKIPLNKTTNVVIIFKGQSVDVYFNNKIVKNHTFKTALAPADKNAIVYICDKWWSVGGFTIKNLCIYNDTSTNLPNPCVSHVIPIKSNISLALSSSMVLNNNSKKIDYTKQLSTHIDLQSNTIKELNFRNKEFQNTKNMESDQIKEIDAKEKLFLTRERTLQIIKERNIYKRKVIYSLIALIFGIIILIIIIYIYYNRKIEMINRKIEMIPKPKPKIVRTGKWVYENE